MNQLVINCFSFELQPVCYIYDGLKVKLPRLNAEEILKVVEIYDTIDSVVLIGPIDITQKIKKDIQEKTNFNLNIKIILGGA